MAASRRKAAVAVLATLATALVACDALLGLDQYKDIGSSCAFDCGSDVLDSGALAERDAAQMPDVTLDDGGPDAEADADAAVTPPDAWPVPTGHEIWAHWPMPNPDAAIGPESSTLLPSQMTYDAGADGGGTVIYDVVTKLSWTRKAQPAASYDVAWGVCSTVGAGWRVPTRIELVSLIDFTQPSGSATIDPTAFPAVQAVRTWTSSAVAGDDGPSGYWVVDFGTALTASVGGAFQVFCVNGGAP